MPNNNYKKLFEGVASRTKAYLVLIAILLIVICCYEIKMVIPSILIYSLLLLYTNWTNKKRRAELSEHIEELTMSVDNVAKNTLLHSPFPLVILETNGNIIWKSAKFVKEFANIDIHNHLLDILKELKNGDIKQKNSIQKEVPIGEKDYRICGEYILEKETNKSKNKEKNYMIMLYFLDETDYLELQRNYKDSELCVAIIMIDNYEEIMQRMANEEKPQIMAQIEKSIYEWVTSFEGLAVKSERDTFVCVFEQKYLIEIEDRKFDILDTIKEIDIPGKIQSTVSIAVSKEGKSNYDKFKTAQAAMDIVLGRGGDQAVIRKDGKYHFFGGRTPEMEKRTKVKARIVAHALEELILESKDVIVMGHTNGDIDSMGSSMGIYRFAKQLGKEAYIVNNTSGISLENFMKVARKEKEYQEAIIDKNEAIAKISPETLLIIVDTHKKSYVEVPELLEETSKIVVIDHHRRSEDYIENAMLTFHEVYASSAAELVTELIEYAETEMILQEIEVEALYAGIMMDTKNFTFKTGVRTFEAAAYLRKCGVDIIKVKKWFQSDLETYHTISEIIGKAEVVNETIAISLHDKPEKDSNIICAKAADELLTISNITASFVIGHLGEKICISGRSIGDINVQVILEKLGGGGHITLAGAQIEGMTMEEVKQELINRINEYFYDIEN